MRLYGVDMPVVTVMSVGMVVVIIVEYEVDSFGGVEHLDMGGIVHQTIHPGLFEADVSDAEIGFAVSQRHELLGDRIIGFRAGTFGDHADYFEFISGNSFREITLRFQGDGNHRFCFVIVACLGRASCAGCH